MKSHTFLALGCLLVFSLFAPASRADDRRFSATLNPADSVQTGLTHLNSDQIAVLDAVIRNDINTAEFQRQPRPALFSQRLSPSEQHNAGFALLNATEIAQLDVCVERFAHPTTTGSELSTTLNSPARESSLTSVQLKRTPEIHGSVTLMVAGGSHGYSAYGGAIDLTYNDPAHHLTIGVGYSEVHSSGGYADRLCSRR